MGDIEVADGGRAPWGTAAITRQVHGDWEIWGPCGGYVAAIALRAAGAESPFARPASFFCHYLSVAAFAPVDLVVTPLRRGPHRAGPAGRDEPGGPAGARGHGVVRRRRSRASSTRTSPRPTCPTPTRCRRAAELRPGEDRPPMPVLGQLRPAPGRVVGRAGRRPARSRRRGGPGCAATPTATFDDPWVDAARSLIVLDVGSWPAGLAPAHVPRAALHRAEPRPLRVVPVSRAARRSGSCSTRTRRWRRAACCRGPGRSGRRSAG